MWYKNHKNYNLSAVFPLAESHDIIAGSQQETVGHIRKGFNEFYLINQNSQSMFWKLDLILNNSSSPASTMKIMINSSSGWRRWTRVDQNLVWFSKHTLGVLVDKVEAKKSFADLAKLVEAFCISECAMMSWDSANGKTEDKRQISVSTIFMSLDLCT